MKEARAKLIKDLPIIGEGVPMMSASQKSIQLDDVVYTGSGTIVNKYEDEDTVAEGAIFAWRVININYKERYYRIRGITGCEESVSHDKGCPHLLVFHVFEDVQRHIQEQLERLLPKAEAKLRNEKRIVASLHTEIESVVLMKRPPAPPSANTEEVSS